MYRTHGRKSGFTLIEILIVVIILGILAAIVIPQFSNASSDARKASLQSTVQTLRSQVALYKLQHGDALPDITSNWDALTLTSTYGTNTVGPYMQSVPTNGLVSGSGSVTSNSSVADGNGDTKTSGYTTAYVYDLTGATGKVWGCDDKGNVVAP
jgi:general secretion pathway protein G